MARFDAPPYSASAVLEIVEAKGGRLVEWKLGTLLQALSVAGESQNCPENRANVNG
jgi:hypothetical protein